MVRELARVEEDERERCDGHGAKLWGKPPPVRYSPLGEANSEQKMKREEHTRPSELNTSGIAGA